MLLFELLQVAIGKRESLLEPLSNDEWKRVYQEALQQSVLGVALVGIQKLPEDQWPPQKILLQWIGIGEQTRLRNSLLNNRCRELISILYKAGFHPTILKGQGIASYYKEPLSQFRMPGDIDVFVYEGRERAMNYAISLCQKSITWDYVHLQLPIWEDVEVELHYHVDILLDVFKNRKLQNWFKANEALLYEKNGELITPTIELNLFYVLLHIYRHFLTGGVGLRQLMDYYFVLLAANGKLPVYNGGRTLESVLKMFGMWKFAQGIMWVMQEVFALERDYMYCEPAKNEGRFILKIVLEGGNFGHNKLSNVRCLGGLNSLFFMVKHNMRIARRYPSEALLSPFWYVWHKCWKITR